MHKNGSIVVSFCLPVYNVKKYIRECINSILAQDISDFEILCLDDCSTDDSYAELLEIKREVPQMHVLKNDQNRGVSHTRNRLIEEARGEYIWFVDPDDIIYPDCAKEILHLAQKTNAEICLGNYLRFAEDDEVQCQPLDGITWRIVENIEHDDYLPIDADGMRMCAIWAGVFNREFVIKHNLRFYEDMISQEDTLFYYEFQLRSTRVVKCDFPCYLYRQRETSVMHIRTTERNKKYYQSMQVMRAVYQQHFDAGDYGNKDQILTNLEVMKQNLALYLTTIDDDTYVREQMRELKAKKLYPYRLNKSVLQSNETFVRKMCKFLLPIEPVFWMVHLLIAKLKIVKF